MEIIIALIFSISVEFGLPPYFVLAVATVESELYVQAVGTNYHADGSISYDLGLMQLNSNNYGTEWDWQDPETNIRKGCEHIINEILVHQDVNTWWRVAVAYNCGYGNLFRDGGPPKQSVKYADKVINKWDDLTNGRSEIYINGRGL